MCPACRLTIFFLFISFPIFFDLSSYPSFLSPPKPLPCPSHSRYEYVDKPRALCYCGKKESPQHRPYSPHSCGEPCRKRGKGNCPHPCTLLCHPGPSPLSSFLPLFSLPLLSLLLFLSLLGACPPCSAMGPLVSCYCGDQTTRLRCGTIDTGYTCGEVCGKTLSCGKHECEEVCHPAKCKKCPRDEIMVCFLILDYHFK